MLPVWVVGLVLLGTYLWLDAELGPRSDPVFAQIHAVWPKTDSPRLRGIPAAQPAPRPRLAQFLARDIEQGLVVVEDAPTRSTVTIRGDNLFAPRTSRIQPEYVSIVGRISGGEDCSS